MGEDHREPHSAGNASGSVRDTLTISEAATFLGVHKNTVRNRIKDGTYEAEQVLLGLSEEAGRHLGELQKLAGQRVAKQSV